MKTIKEQTKYSSWTILKSDIYSLIHKIRHGRKPNEKIECLLTYVIGDEAPSGPYIMHFKGQFWQSFFANTQFYTLQSASTNAAKEWLKYSYQFYENNKIKYLDYFEDGINDFLNRKENKKSDNFSLMGCLDWIKVEKEKLKNESENEHAIKIKELNKKIDQLSTSNEKLENEKKYYLDLENKNIELNIALKAKLAEIEILNNTNTTLTSFLDPANSKNPKITLPNNTKENRIKIIQYLDLLNVGTAQEISEGKAKIGVIRFENDDAFVNLLNKIEGFKSSEKESKIRAEISEARNRHKVNLDQIPDELIKWTKVHFGIEK